ncbi:hypothetical protein NB069_01725 [Leclercia adecarboxylata]|uniref:hypothetical protein n=1 Tax=Leclercia adecarboxylata TaxID=83655 RepID=UPI00202A3623|nr:hypothetical protein [Leclercia adecarboxylata]URN99635.1 hypothetical protein NB069_01725 [Leclercia adecarboxylata]
MKILSTEDMQYVEGGASIFDKIYNRVVNPSKTAQTTDDPFMKNMKRTFGASAGRDLAKIAEKYGLVSLVESIFGW